MADARQRVDKEADRVASPRRRRRWARVVRGARVAAARRLAGVVAGSPEFVNDGFSFLYDARVRGGATT